MRDTGRRGRLGRLADIERRYDGTPPARLLRGAIHGARFRMLHAAAQSRLFDRLAGAAVAAIARRRRRLPRAPGDSRLADLAADLRFCRLHGLFWKRRAGTAQAADRSSPASARRISSRVSPMP